MSKAKLKFIFVAGMEGCGHHGLNPVISKSLGYSKFDGDNPVIIRNKKRLKRIFNWYWCKSHPLPFTRFLVLKMIDRFFRKELEKSINNNETRIIIEDNSFPGGRYRDLEKQWDIIEMVRLVSKYTEDISIIGLYRDPIAATFSHRDFDGGLMEHADVVKKSLIYINKQLEQLPDIKQLYIHYEDLLHAQEELTGVLSGFLGIDDESVKKGFAEIRASKKDWRKGLNEEEKKAINEVFNPDTEMMWPLFSQARRYYKGI